MTTTATTKKAKAHLAQVGCQCVWSEKVSCLFLLLL